VPFFKTTFNILKKCDEDEAHESKWFTEDTLQLPPKIDWDYQRELQVEDVDLWEVLYEEGQGIGVYAAWLPYAEFYMLTTGINYSNDPRYFSRSGDTPYWDRVVETFYGKNAQKRVWARAKELGIPLQLHQSWVETEDMWLHQ